MKYLMVWNFKTSGTTENCTKVIAIPNEESFLRSSSEPRRVSPKKSYIRGGNFLVWLLIFVLFTFSFVFGQVEESFTYDDKGRRDPLLPLVDENGRYLLEADSLYFPAELNLSGILWDPEGKSSALINNQIVKIGESTCGFMIEDITQDSVTVSKDGKEYIISLATEGKE